MVMYFGHQTVEIAHFEIPQNVCNKAQQILLEFFTNNYFFCPANCINMS